MLNIKILCLANGDTYKDIEIAADSIESLIQMIKEKAFLKFEIRVNSCGYKLQHTIYINSEFIISLEI